MKKLQDLTASDFPGVVPMKFETWRQAELSFARSHRSIVLTVGMAVMVVLVTLFVVPLDRGVRLFATETLIVLSFCGWYGYVILRLSPKGKAVKKAAKEAGIHWKTLWVALGLIQARR
jgi:hypothetical protein